MSGLWPSLGPCPNSPSHRQRRRGYPPEGTCRVVSGPSQQIAFESTSEERGLSSLEMEFATASAAEANGLGLAFCARIGNAVGRRAVQPHALVCDST